MKNLLIFSPKSPSHPNHSYTNSSTPTGQTFSSSIIEDHNINQAELIITKWDINSTNYHTTSSLFASDQVDHQSNEFLNSVKKLQSSIDHLKSEDSSSSDILIRAQNVMKIAMKRLEKEFFQMLTANKKVLQPEFYSSNPSSQSRVQTSEEQVDEIQLLESHELRQTDIVTTNLKRIAECMISATYEQECVKIYKLVRKSVIDEGLYNLGVEDLSFAKVQKMDWEVLELKIKQWLTGIKIAVKSLFYEEKFLSDRVFSGSDKIRDSCFAEITTTGALMLLSLPKNVAKLKKSPEKLFSLLDMYEAVSDILQDIESIFSSDSSSSVRSQSLKSLIKLGNAVRTTLSDFEAAIQKDSSKCVVPGGGVHPITRYVMNYFVFLADYGGVLSDILADYPATVQSPLPESYFSSPSPGDGPSSPISIRFAWIILVLLCKFDGKAQQYKDVSLSYLFLANNLNYVVSKVKYSNLLFLLGNEWLVNHENKVKQYATNYVRMGWSKVISSLPDDPTADISSDVARACFERFNSGFDEANRKQSTWVVPDPKLREYVKLLVAKRLLPVYQEFYERNRWEVGVEGIVSFAPEDLGNYLSDLFFVKANTTSLCLSPSGSR